MKPTLSDFVAQYLVDEEGQKTAVLIDYKKFQEMVEQIEEIYLGALAQQAMQQDKECVSHEEAERILLQDVDEG